MGAVLIDGWLGDAERIAVIDDASISQVREAVRARAKECGLATTAAERMVGAASELARNQLAHAIGADRVVGIRAVARAGIPGLEVIAADRGAGIEDPASALLGTPRSQGSLGVGLSAARRGGDELDLDIRYGAGTCVRVRSFAAAVRRSEVGILARPHPDETVIGDHAAIVRGDGLLAIGVVDGLGHGPLAREAADRAIAELLRAPDRPLDQILGDAHAALTGTRGAVMAVARIDAARTLEHAGIGNINTRVLGGDGARPLTSTAGTLGSAYPRRLHVERVALHDDDLLVMATDGLATRIDLAGEPATARLHPIAVAQRLLERFGRGTDDALVIVAR